MPSKGISSSQYAILCDYDKELNDCACVTVRGTDSERQRERAKDTERGSVGEQTAKYSLCVTVRAKLSQTTSLLRPSLVIEGKK